MNFYRIGFVCAAMAALLNAGCTAVKSAPETAQTAVPAPEKELKAVLYIDAGASGAGVFKWAQLLAYSPGIKLHLMNAADIRAGKLQGMDMVLLPGGFAPSQYNALQEDGAVEIRKFVANGGAYVGTCAGLASTLNDKNRLKLLPFHRLPNTGGKYGTLLVEINKRGAELLNVKPSKVQVRYAGGPIPTPGAKAHEVNTGETLAVYKNTVSYFNKPQGNFFNEAAAIYGVHGKGKVIATGFHPESWNSTHNIAMGCIYAVTGLKTFPVMPRKELRPLRVAFFASWLDRVDHVEAMLRLDKDPRIDIKFVAGQEFNEGDLRHVDVLVIPDCKVARKFFEEAYNASELAYFVERGGKIIAAGRSAQALPEKVKAVRVKNNQKLTADLICK